MAFVIECRFCGHSSLNHDHDECAQKFGKSVERSILDHTRKSADVPLPKTIVDKIKSDPWKWYLEYLAREQREEDIQLHMNIMKKKITQEAEKILATKPNQKRLEKYCTEIHHRSFRVRVTPTVLVTIEPVY